MERLSPKCTVLVILALGSLMAGIAAAPAGPGPVLQEEAEPAAKLADAGWKAQRDRVMVMNCAGGDSVNCHRRGNQAGL